MKANTKRTNTTATTNKPATLSASEYFTRKNAGEIAPGTGKKPARTGAPLDYVDYFARKKKGEIAPGTSKPGKNTNKPGKAAKTANNKPTTGKRTSPAALTQSKPNTETNKPGKREQARKNMEDFTPVLFEITNEENRGIIDYSDRIAGLYRLQAVIDGKVKTIARVKLQRDVYILVRENVALALGEEYDLINYNLPAGMHIDYDNAREVVERLYDLFENHYDELTA